MAQPRCSRLGSDGVTRRGRAVAARGRSPVPWPSLTQEMSICWGSCIDRTTIKPKHRPRSTEMMLRLHRKHLAGSPSPSPVRTRGCWPGYGGMLAGEGERAASGVVLRGKGRAPRPAGGGRSCLPERSSARGHPAARKSVGSDSLKLPPKAALARSYLIKHTSARNGINNNKISESEEVLKRTEKLLQPHFLNSHPYKPPTLNRRFRAERRLSRTSCGEAGCKPPGSFPFPGSHSQQLSQ